MASAVCFALRLHASAAPPRGGLTQALGGRKAFCNCVARNRDSLASVGTALRSVSDGVVSSVKSVWRAHTSHALCWPASETMISTISVPRLTRSLRLHPAEIYRVRVRAFPLRFSASAQGLGAHRHPPPPNNSFKPTPCRGVGRVLYATLARTRRPATGRLNSGVRRQKSVWWLCFFNPVTFPASVGVALRYVS